MTVQEIENGICEVWKAKLIREWYMIKYAVENNLKVKALEVPNFRIGINDTKVWGRWIPEHRVIEISLVHLRKHDWNAVVDTLKHEVAHQLDDEYFKFNGTPHGESWKLACKVIGVSDSVTATEKYMAGFSGGDEAIVTKIKKLMAKGSNEGATEAEGQAFLQKAQELMMRYNVELAELINTGSFFIKRPITPPTGRWPEYYYTLGALLKNHYNVQYIHYNSGHNFEYLEIFGEQTNVDVAEYVAHVILQQGDRLYKEFLANHKEKRKEQQESGIVTLRKASKAAFMSGLINGYAAKLNSQKYAVQAQFTAERVNGLSGTEILLASSRILNDHFNKEYNPTFNKRCNSSHGAGYGEGSTAGASLSINAGLSRSNTGKYLNA